MLENYASEMLTFYKHEAKLLTCIISHMCCGLHHWSLKNTQLF